MPSVGIPAFKRAHKQNYWVLHSPSRCMQTLVSPWSLRGVHLSWPWPVRSKGEPREIDLRVWNEAIRSAKLGLPLPVFLAADVVWCERLPAEIAQPVPRLSSTIPTFGQTAVACEGHVDRVHEEGAVVH